MFGQCARTGALNMIHVHICAFQSRWLGLNQGRQRSGADLNKGSESLARKNKTITNGGRQENNADSLMKSYPKLQNVLFHKSC